MKLPDFITSQLVVSAITIFLIVHVMLLSVAYLVYLERKISAYIQDRIGPNRVGFDFGLPFLAPLKGMLGLGQSLADGLKFLLKEDYMPNRVDKILFTLAPMVVVIPALIGFIVMPWGGIWDGVVPFLNKQITSGPVHITGANIGVGIIYLLAVASLGVYGVTLGGYAGNNKFSFLGGLRATAQMISYEIPLGLALLSAILVLGTMIPDQIVRHQVQNGWLIASQPLAAIIFMIAILAEANRAPFDNAECEQELVGGYHTEYSSMRFALFFLAEYSHLFTSSAFFTLLFLGGYHLPGTEWGLPFLPLLSPEATSLWAVLAKLLVFGGKIVLFIAFTMVIRWTIPRLRYDQIMMMAWQQVIPIAMVHVVVVSVMVYFNQMSIPAMLTANLVMMFIVVGIQPFIPKPESNRRVPLYGSRFSPMPGERVITRPTEAMALADHPMGATSPQKIS
jgi:NADH-quinone oxidoreductase subunit H